MTDHEEKEMVGGLIERLRQPFQRYIYFEEPLFYDLCPIYALMTHVYDVFDEVPYLLIYGPKNSGKSRLGDILRGLCLNPKKFDDVSAAFLFRTIEEQFLGVTMIVDEAQELSYRRRDDLLGRIVRSGYRKTGRIGRCGGGLRNTEFTTFCPKVIINNDGLIDPATESRTIPIPMIKSPARLERFRFSKAQKEFKEIKDLIGPFSDEYRGAISDLYDSFQGIDGLSDRDEEIWTPILVIAEVLDAALPEPHIKDSMHKLANKIILQRRIKQLVENRDAQILESTRTYIEQIEPLDPSGLIVGEELWRFIKGRCGLPDLKLETVSRTLNRYAVIKGVRRLRLGKEIKDREIEVQRSCYLIDREKLASLTDEYHDGGDIL